MRLTPVRTGFFTILIVIFSSVIGCGGGSSKKTSPNPFVASKGWKVEDTVLRCARSSHCPPALGVLFTVEEHVEYFYGYEIRSTRVHRCTGALYSQIRVLTAGHCTTPMGGGAQSYFRTVGGNLYRVTRVLKSVFDKNDQFMSDYAAVELATPSYELQFVSPPGNIRPDLLQMTALVVNQPDPENSKVFVLQALDCELDLNEDRSSVPLSQYPLVFGTKGCKLVSGNSGGPMFARGDYTRVLGVLSRSTEGFENTEQANFAHMQRRLRGLPEELNLGSIAHAGCFSLPGWDSPAPQCRPANNRVAGLRDQN